MFEVMSTSEVMNVAGGKTYVCPWCHRVSGGYWKVYAHGLKCSYMNSKVFKYGWNTAIWMLKKGLGM